MTVDDGCVGVALVVWINIALVQGDAIYDHRRILNGDRIAWYSNDALDIVLGWLRRSDEDNHVATSRRAEKIRPFIHQDQFLIVKAWFHTCALDIEVLHGKADHQKHQDGEDNRLDNLAYQPVRLFKIKLWIHAPSLSAGHTFGRSAPTTRTTYYELLRNVSDTA